VNKHSGKNDALCELSSRSERWYEHNFKNINKHLFTYERYIKEGKMSNNYFYTGPRKLTSSGTRLPTVFLRDTPSF
jgi:hypothetical protein